MRRGRAASLAASPTMVGAITTLIVIVAVFLAYNASNGLPFVPVYRVSVLLPNAQRLAPNNEVRVGGSRVGVIESIEPQRNPNPGDGAPPVVAKLDLKLDKSVDPLPARHPGPGPLQVLLRPQVPGADARPRQAACRGGDDPGHPLERADRVRRHLQHLQRADPRGEPAGADRLRRRVRGTRRGAQRDDPEPQPALHLPEAGLPHPHRPGDPPRPLLPGAGPHGCAGRPGL